MSLHNLDSKGAFIHDNMPPPPVIQKNLSTRVWPLFLLTGKTAIVTGAAAGIGLAVAEALAEAGANVAIWYNTNKKAHEQAERISKEYDVKCVVFQVDITNPAAVEETMTKTLTVLNNRLDILIANAGIPWTQGPMVDGSISHANAVLTTNINGVYNCAHSAARHFRRQKTENTDLTGAPLANFTYGALVATASMSGHIVNIPQAQTAYNASKAAVVHMCKSLAVEWAGFARANSVSPGYIVTDISKFCSGETKGLWKDRIPMGREGEVGELKGAYLYLASDAASYTTGCDIIVDGGYCLP